MPITPSASPSLLLELRQLLETDYAIPALWDPDKQVLLDNDAYLHAQVEAIKAGTALAPGSVTDVAIGSRGIIDTHSAPGSSAYDDTLTNHLRTLATRIKAIMGTAAWSSAMPTTLAAAKAHADVTSGAVHGAVSTATYNRLVLRDAAAQAMFGTPTQPQHASRKMEVDAVIASLGSHTHDDRYYTQSQLGSSGAYGSNVVHADRVSVGTLQDARIPSLAASKVTSGAFASARLETAAGDWAPTLVATDGGTFTSFPSSVGKYVRVGPLVTVSCAVSWWGYSPGSFGQIRVAGLPFAARSGFGHIYAPLIFPDGSVLDGTHTAEKHGFLASPYLTTTQVSVGVHLSTGVFTFPDTDLTSQVRLAADGSLRFGLTYVTDN